MTEHAVTAAHAQFVERHHANAEVTLAHFARFDDLRHRRLDHRHRNRKTNPCELPLSCAVSATGRNRGVHANHAAAHVGQRTTGVPRIDRGIGLDEVLVIDIREACGASEPRHDARRHREAEIKRRAKRVHHVALLKLRRIAAQRWVQTARRDLDDRDIRTEIKADQFRLAEFAIKELHLQPIASFDDVRVGHDVTFFIPNPTRPARSVRRGERASLHRHHGADMHHARLDESCDRTIGAIDLLQQRKNFLDFAHGFIVARARIRERRRVRGRD